MNGTHRSLRACSESGNSLQMHGISFSSKEVYSCPYQFDSRMLEHPFPGQIMTVGRREAVVFMIGLALLYGNLMMSKCDSISFGRLSR